MSVESQFRVRVTKDHLVFSAAHFITFNGNICERLHGHNWRVAVEVAGPLDENQYVFDFIALRDALQAIVNELDHRMLLPTQHPEIRVTATEVEVEARFAERRWVFPREDCMLLPVANTTAERIAEWIGGRLREAFRPLPQAQHLAELQVEVEENFGQWAVVRMPLN
jgi:6-pyruvoyltetrahydropterin/6-carboxytetrahydropterin synthase